MILIYTFITLGAFAGGDGESSSDVIELDVFHYLDLADDVSSANFEELVAAFEELHPNIKLNFDYLVNEPYHNKLQTLNIADELPDLMFLWPGKRTGNVTGSGKIKDLRPWIAGHESEFALSAMAPQGPNGEIYELPEQVTATHVMYVNTQLLSELGLQPATTYAELVAQGKTINDAGYITIAMDNKDGWQMQSCLLSALVERTAGREWLKDALAGNASFADPEFVNALSIIKDLSDNDLFSPGINQAEYGRALTDFNTGKAAYFIDGGWRASNIIGEMDEDLQQHIEIMAFPDVPNQVGKSGSTAIVAGTGFGMNANLTGAKADAAWEWVWFFSGPEGSRIKQAQGWSPAYKLPTPAGTPAIQKKLIDFVAASPSGYVIDAVMEAEGMGTLHPLLQQMMFGEVSPQEVGNQYEAWVAQNER